MSNPFKDRPRAQLVAAIVAALLGLCVCTGDHADAAPPSLAPLVGAQAGDPARITGAVQYPAHSLVKLRAENVQAGSAVLWRVSPRADVQRATTKPELLEFAAPPGAYEVELLVMRQADGGGLSVEEVFSKVTVGDGKTDPPAKPGAGKLDPVNALGRIQFGNSGCTATVIGPRRSDGRWDVLTASHCMSGVGAKGTLKTKDGRTLGVRVVVHQADPDLAWMVTEDATLSDLSYANLAAANPAVGVKVWHMGYGIDKPGNREDGTVAGTEDANGQIRFTLSVSPGDSGGGILRADTNELVGTVCCTAGLARKTSMWAASPASCRKARPGAVRLEDLPEPATHGGQCSSR